MTTQLLAARSDGEELAPNIRERYDCTSTEAKIEKIKDIKIVTPYFSDAYEVIQKCHQSPKYSSSPQCALITGPSCSGKTTVFNTYVRCNSEVVHGKTKTQRNIFSAELPSPAKLSSVLESLLEQLGDPFPLRGTIGNKNHRLVNLIKDCRVELIMLDEFHHFVNPDNQKVLYEVSRVV